MMLSAPADTVIVRGEWEIDGGMVQERISPGMQGCLEYKLVNDAVTHSRNFSRPR